MHADAALTERNSTLFLIYDDVVQEWRGAAVQCSHW